MPEQMEGHLEGLQQIDEQIEQARTKIDGFEPLLEEVDKQAAELEKEVTVTRARLLEMKVDERRLDLSAEERRTRIRKLEERLSQVRNVREEAAVTAELDLVRRALEGDEQEAFTVIDQLRKLEERLDEQEAAVTEARDQVAPRRQELVDERKGLDQALNKMKSQRDAFTEQMSSGELRVYESIRGKGNRRAVSRLTPDGACGHCFNMVPLQLRNEIRHGSSMIRCEACGVILATADDHGEDENG